MMVIPHNITADFSNSSDGPVVQATYSGHCLADDFCSFGGQISPGDWIQPLPDSKGWIHPLCAHRMEVPLSDGHRRVVKGYSDERAADKPTKFSGTSIDKMGY